MANEAKKKIDSLGKNSPLEDDMMALTALFNQLTDVDKHYERKEYLL